MLKINKDKIKQNKLGRTISPQDVSKNIESPEINSFDKRISRRTQKLATQVTPDFKRLLKQLSVDHNCLMVEIIEKAVIEFSKKHSKK
jgi:hypothetical protein